MKLLSLLPYYILTLKIEAHPYSYGGDSGQHVMNHKHYTSSCSTEETFTSQTTWNLARLCQPSALTENEGMNDGTKNRPSCLKPNLGSGVLVYVLDNGVDGTHSVLGDRVRPGKHVFTSDQPGNTETFDPKNKLPSHGTRVAAVIAGEGVGVAPAATIIPFNMYDPDARQVTETGIWVGMRMIVSDFAAEREKNPEVQAVINISAESTDEANILPNEIGKALDLGMHVVISAGNGNADICAEWVSRHPRAQNVITVGGTDIRDERLLVRVLPRDKGSNFGECVDFYAPGLNVHTVATSQVVDDFDDGTSFSAPLVSGIIAAILGEGEKFTPADMKKHILEMAPKIIPVPGSTKRQPLAQFDPRMKV